MPNPHARDEGYDYPLAHVLELLTGAANYNAYLAKTVRQYARTDQSTLDFGAGIGTFAIPLHEAGYDITALEPSDQQRRLLVDRGLATAAMLADLRDQRFDYIYTLNVLEHIDADQLVLAELFERLRSNGILLVYVPAFRALWTRLDDEAGHLRRYKRGELAFKLRNSGFVVENIAYVDCIGFLVALVARLIGGRSGNLSRATISIYDTLLFPLSRRLDPIFSRFFGKNLLAVCRKRDT